MKNITKFLVMSALILQSTQAFGMNAQFKANFIDDLPTEELPKEIIETEPTLVEIEMSKTVSYLRDIEEVPCINKDGVSVCPLTAVDCKKVESNNGKSTKHTKTIEKNRENGECPDDTKSVNGKCLKEYSFYTYACNSGDLGPLKSTGSDCLGQCGPYGCSCNAEKVEGNCETNEYKCPLGDDIACVNILDSKEASETIIYALGTSSKQKGTMLGLKECDGEFIDNRCVLDGKEIEARCSEGFVEKDGQCFKDYTWYKYSCPKGFEIKSEGFQDERASSVPPENNCFKKVLSSEKSDTFKRELKMNPNKTFGAMSQDEFSLVRGFIHPDNASESLTKIKGEGDRLVFEKGLKRYDFFVKGCEFEGEISAHRIKGLLGQGSLISTNGKGRITSNCLISGLVGTKNDPEAIVAAKGLDDRIIFWDSFMNGDLGYLQFFNVGTTAFELPVLSAIYKDGFTYMADLNNFPEVAGEVYEDRGLYITKVRGDKTLASNKIVKIEKRVGFDSYKCSTGCSDGMCSTASCKPGTFGIVRTKAEFVGQNACVDQVCDGYKEYGHYCGVEAGDNCDTTKPGVIMQDGKCYESTCVEGSLNPFTGKCEK